MIRTVTGLLWMLSAAGLVTGQANYLIGRGITDITGLLADGRLYGYGRPDQDARGNHIRQFARCFVIADVQNQTRVAIVTADITMFSQALVTGIAERLRDKGLGSLYSEKNVMMTPNHSHSAPGGYHTYMLYQTPDGGFINETYDIIVEGVAESIRLAHSDLQWGNILVNHGDVVNASINRSPPAYNNNPASERASYQYDVDREMQILKFVSESNESLGVLSIFPVHTTSMKNTNNLVSGDNKGYAAQMMERQMDPDSLPGQGKFVAAFAQSNEGDVSPNIDGAKCTDTGLDCDPLKSTCPPDDLVDLCVGKGPTDDMFEDTRIIGDRQFQMARDLYNNAVTVLSGPISSRHQFVNMTTVTVNIGNQEHQLCKPAMGYSFAAGASDGPGTPPFFQGDTEGDPVIDAIIDALLPPSDELIDCHQPKPILLATGEVDDTWKMQPDIVPIQVFRIGDIVLIGVPAEITTMAGRRLRTSIKQAMEAAGAPSTIKPVIIGLANFYSHYIVTFEEYQIQRYEGACTIFGPYTLNGYQQVYNMLARAIITGEAVDPGPTPPDYRGFPDYALDPVPVDLTYTGTSHGDTLTDANPSYNRGSEVRVAFVAGNPRINHSVTRRYVEILRQSGSDWTVVYTDAHWETKFMWNSNCHLSEDPNCDDEQISNATITWSIPANEQPGIYRIRHDGFAHIGLNNIISYRGTSRPFSVQ